jgi:hypothetical protein
LGWIDSGEFAELFGDLLKSFFCKISGCTCEEFEDVSYHESVVKGGWGMKRSGLKSPRVRGGKPLTNSTKSRAGMSWRMFMTFIDVF